MSYFTPIKHEVFKSDVSERIELNWVNGKIVIDTKRANYSYGNLQKVLREGLKKIGFEQVRSLESALILGLGGGSVVKTLVDEIGFAGKIIGIEYDPVMIGIGKKYFDLDKITHLTIHQDDAFEFMNRNAQKADLIIVDIFLDIFMPEFIFDEIFLSNLSKSLKVNGFLIFNTIIITKESAEKVKQLEQYFAMQEFNIQRFDHVIGDNNCLLIIQKISS